ncbi:MAG: carboxypeptidase-like regulatory domain-containing protein [Spirochaetia bacterium]|jgi:tetratricopeptide (TPR) repeat protein|nr:carboxypeptidase-like regulatory domain-containing protein [Spirochaetia bacterium]
MKKYFYSLLLLITLASSCKSVDNGSFSQFTEAPLFGMIYDSESSPVAGALVVLDDEKSAKTDINGRVLFSAVSYGEHSVVITKDGFEETQMVLNFSNRDQVLYSTLFSLQNILDNLESSMQNGKMLEAKSFLMRASGINSEDIRLRYLNVVYLSEMKEYPEVLKEIGLLREIYPNDPYIVMTQAKILFYGLERQEEALEVLQSILPSNSNEELENLLGKMTEEKTGETND